MAVDKTPVLKRCRSLGLNPMYLGVMKKESKRQPHRNPRAKDSEYAQQLREKQKAKFIYGVTEQPFRNYFEKAKAMPGQTGDNLMILLETRLDSVIFRLGFARTRRESRQIVSHSQVAVNGKNVNIASYLVKAGDVIEIRENCKDSQRYKDILDVTAARVVPSWLEADQEKLSGKVLALPTMDQIDVNADGVVNVMYIVELYSKN